jgi:hypothetical protein
LPVIQKCRGARAVKGVFELLYYSRRRLKDVSTVKTPLMFSEATARDTLKQMRPIGEGDQELEKRLVQEELT